MSKALFEMKLWSSTLKTLEFFNIRFYIQTVDYCFFFRVFSRPNFVCFLKTFKAKINFYFLWINSISINPFVLNGIKLLCNHDLYFKKNLVSLYFLRFLKRAISNFKLPIITVFMFCLLWKLFCFSLCNWSN